MYKEVKVGNTTVPMLANGATPIRYRMVFGKDIISEFQLADEDGGRVSTIITELAFIMAKAAEAQNGQISMATLNQETFVDWLEQFEPMDLAMASEEIVEVYMGNQITHSEVKKKVKEPRTDK